MFLPFLKHKNPGRALQFQTRVNPRYGISQLQKYFILPRFPEFTSYLTQEQFLSHKTKQISAVSPCPLRGHNFKTVLISQAQNKLPERQVKGSFLKSALKEKGVAWEVNSEAHVQVQACGCTPHLPATVTETISAPPPPRSR